MVFPPKYKEILSAAERLFTEDMVDTGQTVAVSAPGSLSHPDISKHCFLTFSFFHHSFYDFILKSNQMQMCQCQCNCLTLQCHTITLEVLSVNSGMLTHSQIRT